MTSLFAGTFQNKKIFITGHTGFKGSWLSLWLHQLGATVKGYSLPPNTTPNHFSLLELPMQSELANINNLESIINSIQSFEPDLVFHMAAQPLVRQSYDEPIETFETNVLGSLKVYEACRKCSSVKGVVAITTDKVYENNEWHWPYRENDRLGGRDPYSASKAAMEILNSSYRKSFLQSEALISVRSGNVFGGGDWAKDRLIPDLVKSFKDNNSATVRNPDSIRPWQHVLEPLSGYLCVGQKILLGQPLSEAYNFGPRSEDDLTVLELVKSIKNSWPQITFTVDPPKDEPHEAKTLRLDWARAHAELNWRPVWSTEQAVQKTAKWYKNFYQDNKVSTLNDLKDFITSAQEQNQPWT